MPTCAARETVNLSYTGFANEETQDYLSSFQSIYLPIIRIIFPGLSKTGCGTGLSKFLNEDIVRKEKCSKICQMHLSPVL